MISATYRDFLTPSVRDRRSVVICWFPWLRFTSFTPLGVERFSPPRLRFSYRLGAYSRRGRRLQEKVHGKLSTYFSLEQILQ